MKTIGGFFPLEHRSVTTRKIPKSVYECLLAGKHYANFSSARGALLFMIEVNKSSRIWLPEIFCDIFADRTDAYQYRLQNNTFDPDIEFLQKNLKPDDIVVVVDYFGTEPSSKFLAFAKEKSQVHWIQDASQSMNPQKYWGDFTLFSPRKLFGVLDGGILIQNNFDKNINLKNIDEYLPLNRKFSTAAILRRIDVSDIGISLWHKIYQWEEKNIGLDLKRCSKLTMRQLERIDFLKLVQLRIRNFMILDEILNPLKIKELKFTGNVTPFGYPIYIQDRDVIQEKLGKNGIFAAVHWRSSSTTKTDRQNNHESSQLTLPCDHRYTEEDMLKIVKTIQKHVKF